MSESCGTPQDTGAAESGKPPGEILPGGVFQPWAAVHRREGLGIKSLE